MITPASATLSREVSKLVLKNRMRRKASVPSRVVRRVQTPFRQSGTAATGQQRIGGTLSVAVDPRPDRSGTVYLAWGDRNPQSDFILHVRASTNRGANWSAADLLTVPNGTNAALAINNQGSEPG